MADKTYKYKFVAGSSLIFGIFVLLGSIGGIYAEKINNGQIYVDTNFLSGVFFQLLYSLLLVYGSVKYYIGKEVGRKIVIMATVFYIIFSLLRDVYFIVKYEFPIITLLYLLFPLMIYLFTIRYRTTDLVASPKE